MSIVTHYFNEKTIYNFFMFHYSRNYFVQKITLHIFEMIRNLFMDKFAEYINNNLY